MCYSTSTACYGMYFIFLNFLADLIVSKRSPLPQGGLEVPITLIILQNNAGLAIYDIMQDL